MYVGLSCRTGSIGGPPWRSPLCGAFRGRSRGGSCTCRPPSAGSCSPRGRELWASLPGRGASSACGRGQPEGQAATGPARPGRAGGAVRRWGTARDPSDGGVAATCCSPHTCGTIAHHSGPRPSRPAAHRFLVGIWSVQHAQPTPGEKALHRYRIGRQRL